MYSCSSHRSSRVMLLLLLVGTTSLTFSFQLPARTPIHPSYILTRSSRRQQHELGSQVSNDSSLVDNADFLQDAEILEVSMPEHRPLGCTVEESLGHRYGPLVFCSKVTPLGFADQAGIQPGDVFLGVSDMFGGIEDVTTTGLERVRALVSACPTAQPLLLRLARGTPVMLDHEEAVVDLCSNPGKADSEVDECVTDFLRAGYYTEGQDAVPEEDTKDAPGEDDNDDLLDNMFNMWAEDLPAPPPLSTDDLGDSKDEQSKPKPWSSRSSPSGTFVRDPRTGKMTNIDA